MVKTNQQKIVRCACYTRKSHEVDVDQNFNSLEAQREACENYIASQKSNGWMCLPQHYDDGGYSGGNLNRPALERLKADIEAGQVDMIVIYKIDRLTRCLADLSDLQEFFDAHDVSFSSVTQEINTSTSAGRMMLNILMTFAQYEREIIADRVRDRVVAAKKKGMHCGGYPVLGYDVNPVTHKLEINEKEAEIVRFVFDKYNECGSAKEVAAELEIRGCRGKVWTTRKGVKHDGQHINNMMIYRMLKSPLYIGRVPHKKTSYPGEHKAIISQDQWDKAQKILNSHLRYDAKRRSPKLQPFAGLVYCGHCGGAVTLSHTVKHGNRRYSYYICNEDTKRNFSICPTPRIPAADFETLVIKELTVVLKTPTMLAQVDSRLEEFGTGSAIAVKALENLTALWEVMCPAERYALIHAIVQKITIFHDHIRIDFNKEGIVTLLTEAGMEKCNE